MRVSQLTNLGRIALEDPTRVLSELQQRPALMLLVANFSAQSISVVLSPLLSRIYTPHQFGLLGALTAVIMVGVPLTTGRYELALPRAKTEREAYAVVLVCCAVIAFMTAVFGALAFVLTRSSGPAWTAPLREYWYFVPLCLSLIALYDMLAIEASRRGELSPLAASKVTQSTFGVGGQIVFGLLGFGTFGLLSGFAINQAAGVTRLFRAFVVGHRGKAPLDLSELAATARRHRHFPLYTSWANALDSGTRWALQFAVSTLWDPRIGGFIFLSDRIIGRPLQLLGTSLLPVYIADVSKAMRDAPSEIPNLFRSTLRKQAIVSVTWTAAAVLTVPWLIGPLFGSQWTDSVHYVQLMALAVLPPTILQCVTHTLQLARRQRQQSILVVTKALAIVAVLAGSRYAQLDAFKMLSIVALVQLAFGVVTYVVFRTAVTAMAREKEVSEPHPV
jgi:O-antigen/teichoic acid export membrane protein